MPILSIEIPVGARIGVRGARTLKRRRSTIVINMAIPRRCMKPTIVVHAKAGQSSAEMTPANATASRNSNSIPKTCLAACPRFHRQRKSFVTSGSVPGRTVAKLNPDP